MKGMKIMTYCIKDALKKQFDLLSQASETCVDGDELRPNQTRMSAITAYKNRRMRRSAPPEIDNLPPNVPINANSEREVASKGVVCDS